MSRDADGFGPWSAPLAGLFGVAALSRRWLYDHKLLPAAHAGLPTFAVGGLEAGGSGKTPVTRWLLSVLVASGRRPGLLSRGYGRQSRGLVVRRTGEQAAADHIGDEPALIAQSVDVPIAACADRRLGAAALRNLGCDTLVLDDGFQHRRLARDLDIVVLRGEAPLGRGHFLPWGSLREPASSLARAQVIWIHSRGERDVASLTALRGRFADKVFVESRAVFTRVSPAVADDGSHPSSTPVLAAAGIARPAAFFSALVASGLEVRGARAFVDHHAFSDTDLTALAEEATRRACLAVAVTAKDAVKIAGRWQGPPLWVFDTRVEIVEGGAALATALALPTVCLPDSPR